MTINMGADNRAVKTIESIINNNHPKVSDLTYLIGNLDIFLNQARLDDSTLEVFKENLIVSINSSGDSDRVILLFALIGGKDKDLADSAQSKLMLEQGARISGILSKIDESLKSASQLGGTMGPRVEEGIISFFECVSDNMAMDIELAISLSSSSNSRVRTAGLSYIEKCILGGLKKGFLNNQLTLNSGTANLLIEGKIIFTAPIFPEPGFFFKRKNAHSPYPSLFHLVHFFEESLFNFISEENIEGSIDLSTGIFCSDGEYLSIGKDEEVDASFEVDVLFRALNTIKKILSVGPTKIKSFLRYDRATSGITYSINANEEPLSEEGAPFEIEESITGSAIAIKIASLHEGRLVSPEMKDRFIESKEWLTQSEIAIFESESLNNTIFESKKIIDSTIKTNTSHKQNDLIEDIFKKVKKLITLGDELPNSRKKMTINQLRSIASQIYEESDSLTRSILILGSSDEFSEILWSLRAIKLKAAELLKLPKVDYELR